MNERNIKKTHPEHEIPQKPEDFALHQIFTEALKNRGAQANELITEIMEYVEKNTDDRKKVPTIELLNILNALNGLTVDHLSQLKLSDPLTDLFWKRLAEPQEATRLVAEKDSAVSLIEFMLKKLQADIPILNMSQGDKIKAHSQVLMAIKTQFPELRTGVNEIIMELHAMDHDQRLAGYYFVPKFDEDLPTEEIMQQKRRRYEAFATPEEQQFEFDHYELLATIGTNVSDELEAAERIQSIRRLHKRYPGLARKLFQTYGVINFYDESEVTKINALPYSHFMMTPKAEDLSEEKLDVYLQALRAILSFGNLTSVLRAKQILRDWDRETQGKPTNFDIQAAYEEAEINIPYAIERDLSLREAVTDTGIVAQSRRDLELDQLLLTPLVKPYGISAKSCIESWKTMDHAAVTSNLHEMERLEATSPGSVKILFKEFGIRNFCRYPTDVLLHQVAARTDKERPYGVIINPISDWNEAFEEDKYLWEKMFLQLQQAGYELRIVEAAGKIELAKRLLTFEQTYGERQKISFAFIGGHGTEDSINFGGEEARNELHINDLTGHGAARTHQYFTENPTIILNSCSTGADEGIGKKISEVLHATVKAPNIPTSFKDINAALKNGRLAFEIEYEDANSNRAFTSGKPLASDR